VSKKILIVAGEASGDLYGALLVEAIKKLDPQAEFFGIGGQKMRGSGVDILFPIDELSIIGIPEVISKLGVIRKAFSAIDRRISREDVGLAILVNYPGFNLKLSKILKEKKIPVAFYSSPQVWAWAKWRVNIIKRYVDKMIVFFKFEKEFYKKCGVEAEFVGHPLVDIVKPEGCRIALNGAGPKTIALIPGSRKSEIRYILATMLKAAEIIHKADNSIRFIVTKHPSLAPELYLERMRGSGLPITLVDGKTYDCIEKCDMAIVMSGSVTLEVAILNKPMVITNKISLINGLIYLLLVRLANVGLVNIVAGRRVMPELLQYDATPKRIAGEALDIINNRERYDRLKEELKEVNRLIGVSGASDRAARSLLPLYLRRLPS
jgi:lipid-A-disaccharide synthase